MPFPLFRKSFLVPISSRVFLNFSSVKFRVSDFIWGPWFTWNWVLCKVKGNNVSLFLHMAIQFCWHHLGRCCLFCYFHCWPHWERLGSMNRDLCMYSWCYSIESQAHFYASALTVCFSFFVIFCFKALLCSIVWNLRWWYLQFLNSSGLCGCPGTYMFNLNLNLNF